MLLDGPDLFHLTQEAPGRPTHTIKLATLDGLLPHGELRAWLAEAVQRVPVLRRRVQVEALRPVRWAEGDVDVDVHLVDRVALAGHDAVLDHLAALANLPLDRDRPLWALHHLVDETEGRSILAFRIHHALADGAASVRLWEALADRETHGRDQTTTVPEDPPGRLRYAAQIALDAPRLAKRWREHSRRLAETTAAGRTAAVEPFSGPSTSFNDHLEGVRSCATADLALDTVREIRARTGASTNDILLAVCGGAVRRHLEMEGSPIDGSLTATVPAALPQRREPFGNAVTTLYVSLHSALDDPLKRLSAISADVRSARDVLDHDPRLLADSQRRWRFYQGLVAGMRFEERRRARPAYNLIVSSVRGPVDLEILGHAVVDLRSFGPLAGRLGLNVTAWSYGDRLAVGIHAFRAASASLDRLGRLLEEELHDLAIAAGGEDPYARGATHGIQPR